MPCRIRALPAVLLLAQASVAAATPPDAPPAATLSPPGNPAITDAAVYTSHQGVRRHTRGSLVTVMFRREDGYDPGNKNWFWATYKPDGVARHQPRRHGARRARGQGQAEGLHRLPPHGAWG